MTFKIRVLQKSEHVDIITPELLAIIEEMVPIHLKESGGFAAPQEGIGPNDSS